MDLSLKTYSPALGGGPEEIPFAHTVRNTFMRGSLSSLKISVAPLLCGPNLTVATIVTELGNLRWQGQVVTHTCQGKVDMDAVIDSNVREAISMV